MPEPSQVALGVKVSPMHVWAGPQVLLVLACAHMPPAPHWPVFPQTFPGDVAQSGSAPDDTGAHVPTEPIRLQAWQAPLQVVLQHTPSAQLRPLPQAPPVAGQACPAIHPVHWCVVVLQPAPFAQSASTMHDVLQMVPLHVKVPHELVVPAAQTPAPEQVPAVVIEKLIMPIPLAEHDAAPHDIGAGAAGHDPVPLQVDAATDENPSAQDAARQMLPVFLAQAPPAAQRPVSPQPVGVASTGHIASLVPAVTLVHEPVFPPPRLQAWQGPLQAVLQQTPSAQVRPVTQSPVTLHIAPCACLLPHSLVNVLQGMPTQSLSEAQVLAHWVAFRHL